MFAKPAPLELLSKLRPRPQISHVIFDFDGTLSWLRHGWPQVMCELFASHYPAPAGQTGPETHDLLMSEILSQNGRPSIYQMLAFHQRVRDLGGACPSPEDLLLQYQSRLDSLVTQRTDKIQRGEARPDEFVVYGARAFLESLRERKLWLIVLSGSIQHQVQEECVLLGLADYFGAHIYGSALDPRQFSKKAVIERLLREEKISGGSLLSFGDGPGEIQETKNVGGSAVAIASDEEENGGGRMDPWKRRQLTQAGADAVMADYRDAGNLMDMLMLSEP